MTLPIADFLPVWGFLAANIASPGPNVLNTIACAMGGGRRAGLASALGVGFGIVLWCLGMVLGAASLFALLPGAQRVLTLAAIVLLLSFASRYLRSAWAGARRAVPANAPVAERLAAGAAFRRALLVIAVNPKALTSWLAILGLFPVERAGATDVAVLCLGASGIAFGLHALYALAFSTPAAARLFLSAGWVLQALAGLLFIGFALRLAIQA